MKNSIKYSLQLLLFFLISISNAQTLHTTISIKSGAKLKDFRSFALGDSILLFYTDPSDFNFVCILPDGKVTRPSFKELEDKEIFAIEDYSDTLKFYYYEIKKESAFIKSVVLNKNTNALSYSPQSFPIHGRLLGTHQAKNLLLVTLEDNATSLKITELKDLTIESERSFKLDPTMYSADFSSLSIISGDGFIRPSQSGAEVKLFPQENALFITFDQSNAYLERFKTIVSKLDFQTGKTETRVFKVEANNKISSVVYLDKVIQACIRKETMTLKVFNFLDSKLETSLVVSKETFPKEFGYERHDMVDVIYGIKPWDAIRSRGTPFITPYPTDSGSIILKVGTTEQIKSSTGTPMVSGLGPLVLLVSAAVKIATWQSSSTHSIDRYFYLKGTSEAGFTYYDSKTDLPDERIDNYELKFHKDKYFLKKGSIKNSKNVYGLYRYKRDRKKLEVYKF